MLWLVEKIRSHQIDSVFSAELPDLAVGLELCDLGKTHMIQGPCGALNVQSPCIKDSQRTKLYPESFMAIMTTSDNGYPNYRWLSPKAGGCMCEFC